ncbi:sensor histidine kinase [Nocardioides solisilvae]|uniref:sensor histidine kinase n=1 Tax=Nocardioides solisilvae TaxID=1542435 RepID=UPI000D74A983|nr:histidine kinase [Nocardioides solisilvae]
MPSALGSGHATGETLPGGSAAADPDLALALALPLAVRRRWPVAVAATVALALQVQVAVGGGLHFGSFVAVLTAAWVAGRWATGWGRVCGGAALLLVGIVAATLADLVETPGEALIPSFYVAAATGAGRVVHVLATQAEDLRRLNEALARERDASVRLAVATERMRLSRDLHDSVAHTLMVTVVQSEVAVAALPDDPEAARAAVRRVGDAGRRGLADLRSTLRVLRSPGEGSGGGTLAELPVLAGVLTDSGLDVAVDLVGDPGTVPEALSRDLFRVVREALTNVVKHSGASSARVTLACRPDRVDLEVRDPGPVASGERVTDGHRLPRPRRDGGPIVTAPGTGSRRPVSCSPTDRPPPGSSCSPPSTRTSW